MKWCVFELKLILILALMQVLLLKLVQSIMVGCFDLYCYPNGAMSHFIN